MLIPLATGVLKTRQSAHFLLAERIRRLVTLRDGLGIQIAARDLTEIEADATSMPALELGGRDPSVQYFNSPLAVGPGRLAHIIQESAFFTSRLASVTAGVYGAMVGVGVVGAITVTWFGILAVGGSPVLPSVMKLLGSGENVAKLAAGLAVFFCSGVLVTLRSEYATLGQSAQRVFEKADALRQEASPDPVEVVLLFSEYNAAVQRSPPIPGTVYAVMRGRLSVAWERHLGAARPQA